MKLTKIFYLIKEGVKSIFTHGFMSFACVLVILACLLIMGNFALLSLNIDHNIKQLESQNEILAFVDENLSLEDAKAIGPRLRTLDNVLDVQFVTTQSERHAAAVLPLPKYAAPPRPAAEFTFKV